jgi:anti-sigma regulatory factor (Ser/Thr protein kinase)
MSFSPTADHSAFLYDSDDDYLATLVPYLCAALDRGHGVVVATSRARMTLLGDGLGDAAADVEFLPHDEWHVRPDRTIAGWARILAASAARGHAFTRLVDEIRFGEPPAHRLWVRYESAMNRVLAGAAADRLCPYDTRALPAAVTDTALRTHPCLYDKGQHPSPGFVEPELLLREVPEPEVVTTGPPALELPVGPKVAGLREAVRGRAQRDGWLSDDRLEDFVLALSEVTTNGIRHGGGRRRLAIWVTDHAIACEMTDDGGTPPGPLAGYLPPKKGAVGGMGLWLVRQVCDAVHIGAAAGLTRVRFRMDR